MNYFFKSGFYGSPLEYENVHLSVEEAVKLENKMVFYFKNSKKNIKMIEEDDEEYRKKLFIDFVRKNLNLTKLEIIVMGPLLIEDQPITNVTKV